MKSYKSLFAVAVLTASVLLIQPMSASAQQDRPRGGGGPGGIPGITEDQRAALQEMNRETRDLSRQAAQARNELNDAIFAETVDEAQIKQKAAALAKIESDIAVARAKAFAKIRGKFNKEQIEALKQNPMGGRGGGAGGRQPGGGRAQRGAQ